MEYSLFIQAKYKFIYITQNIYELIRLILKITVYLLQN